MYFVYFWRHKDSFGKNKSFIVEKMLNKIITNLQSIPGIVVLFIKIILHT